MPGSPDPTWREIHQRLVPLMRVDNRTNFFYIAREYLILSAVLAGCIWAYNARGAERLSTWSFVPIAMAGMFAVASIQHRFSALAHDASHYALFRNKLANELISDIFLMFPIMGMTQRFRATHLGHHRYLNDPERDPDVVRLNQPTKQRFPVSHLRFVGRYVVRALWPPSTWSYLMGQAKGANLSDGSVGNLKSLYRFRLGRCMRGAFWISVLTAVYALRAWPIFLLFWVLPLLTFFPLLMQLREISHHSNTPDSGDLTGSRIFRVHPLLSACVFPYGQDDHLTHHLFAMVPHYNMRAAHQILMEWPEYREKAVVCNGFFFRRRGTDGPTILDVMARKPRPGELIWDGPPRRIVPIETGDNAPQPAATAG